MRTFLILIIIAVFAAGCTQQKGGSDSTALAQVNNVTITKEDFMKKIKGIPEWARTRFQDEEGKKNFLDEIIKEELLNQEAKKQGIDKSKDFQNKIEEFKKMTLISTLLKQEIEEKAKLDDQEIRAYYDNNQSEYMSGLEIEAKHILVATEEEANEILNKIKANEDFSELAKEFSKDKGSAVKGGTLGFFGKGRMVPEFEKAAFNLGLEEVSEPVKTQFGYHIIKVTGINEGKIRGFDEVKSTIEKRLTVEKQKALFESYVEKLKGNASKIKIHEEVLKSLSTEGTLD